ncbi:hypothetical protein [Streptomyces sp. NPDC001903]|uniref:hypothetical protein n=1 Tax=Streptomyces sp. NPDC001903 TaxID=3364622 RepID=UPI00367C324B
MSDNTPNSKGPAPATLGTEATQPPLIPADQVKPEDVGTLAIEYRDGVPVIVVSGGPVIPAIVRVEDRSGNVAGSARFNIFDPRNISEPIAHLNIDLSSGGIMPFFDR